MPNIREYLTNQQKKWRTKHQKEKEKEKIVQTKEKDAYEQASEQARIQRAKDRAYHEQGYRQTKDGTLTRTKKQTHNNKRGIPSKAATNYTNNYSRQLQKTGPFGSLQKQSQPHKTPFTQQYEQQPTNNKKRRK